MPPHPSALLDLLLLPFISLFSLCLPTLRRLLLRILSFGPVPVHIAFIMDGNRRWASSQRVPLPVKSGHLTGFSALRSILEACLELKGLSTVTVYAFAIDNFKRSPEEVDALMDIAKRNLAQLAGHGEVLARHSVRLRIIGRKELLPPDVRAAVERVERMTSGNRRATLNVCIPYASRDEMAGAVRDAVEARLAQEMTGEQGTAGLKNGADRLGSSDEEEAAWAAAAKVEDKVSRAEEMTIDEIEARMLLAHSPPLDILVRTSGVHRLSDFMLWQCNDSTQLQFTERYWPLFGLRELVPIVLDFQRAKWRQRWERQTALPPFGPASSPRSTAPVAAS